MQYPFLKNKDSIHLESVKD